MATPTRKASLSTDRWVIGKTVERRSIEAFAFGAGPGRGVAPMSSLSGAVLILGGMHGDEPKGVYVARRLRDLVRDEPELVAGCRLVIVPVVNPDGFARRKRRNARSVDLNRNYPTANWAPSKRHSRFFPGSAPASEPETRAVVQLIEQLQPDRILTLHSIGHGEFCNNYDGPARAWAQCLHAANGYRVTATIGYPTPGSFGSWAGGECRIPTITLELPSHHSREKCWCDNRAALLAFVGAPPVPQLA